MFVDGLIFLTVVSQLLTYTDADCTGDVHQWEPVPEDEYDRNYHSISNTNARPLGFKVGTYKYNEAESLCVKVSGTSNRNVEVMFETEPASTLCVKNVNDDSSSACITTKTYQKCGSVLPRADNSTTYEFYCNGECSESDVNFWYRFRVCPFPTSDDNEKWCRNVHSDFPSTLIKLPDGIIFTTTTQRVNSAQRTSLSYLALAMLVLGWGTW